MRRSLRVFAATLGLALVGSGADGGSIRGQAKDNFAQNVANVTIDFFSIQGTFLGSTEAAAGSYNFAMAAAPGYAYVTLVFTSPGRAPAVVTVRTADDNAIDVVMPLRETNRTGSAPEPAKRRRLYRINR